MRVVVVVVPLVRVVVVVVALALVVVVVALALVVVVVAWRVLWWCVVPAPPRRLQSPAGRWGKVCCRG